MAVIEANIDDMNPEIYGVVMERLFKAGAVDVYLTPIIMKKARPANILTTLSPVDKLNQIIEVYFKETTSIGLRINYVDKRYLPREVIKVSTPWGPVLAKACYYQNQLVNLAPEYEDCRRLSDEVGVSVKMIYQAIGREE